MTQNEEKVPGNSDAHVRLCSPYVNVVLVASLAIAAFYLVSEHRAHLYGYLSWLLPVAFIALHFWMHTGHRHGSHRSHGDQRRDPPPDRQSGAHQH